MNKISLCFFENLVFGLVLWAELLIKSMLFVSSLNFKLAVSKFLTSTQRNLKVLSCCSRGVAEINLSWASIWKLNYNSLFDSHQRSGRWVS